MKMAGARKIPPRRAEKPLSGAEHARYMKRAAAQKARTEKVVAGLMRKFGMKGTPKTMHAGDLWRARMRSPFALIMTAKELLKFSTPFTIGLPRVRVPVVLALTPAEKKVLEEDHMRFQNLKKIGLIKRT